MYYNIEIDYETGGSFHTERCQEMLDVPVHSLETAKENLKRIKNHYLKHKNSMEYSEDKFRLTLLTDEGTHTMEAFWMGYFETLYAVEIVIQGDSDLKVTFS